MVRVLVLVLAFALASCGRETARFATQDIAVDGASAAALVSQYRASKGLGPVAVDPKLSRIALDQARANAAIGDLSHDVGGSFASRLAAHDFDRTHAAENLAAGAASVPEAIAQWKASPGHDRNLLLPQVQRIGLARVDAPASRYKRYWALVLADR
jgi:uncharacterized protein YkwD